MQTSFITLEHGLLISVHSGISIKVLQHIASIKLTKVALIDFYNNVISRTLEVYQVNMQVKVSIVSSYLLRAKDL